MASRGERILSQFVGREQEFATLAALFTQVEAGHGQVVGVVAEAGGGKSRLLYESRQRWHDKRVTYLEGRCVSYGSTIPYHPLIDLVRQNCGIAEGDSATTIGAKVRFALQEVGMDAEASSPYFLQLLGVKEGTESLAALTPEAVRTRTFDTSTGDLKKSAVRSSCHRGCHWIVGLRGVSGVLVERGCSAILLLTTYRPGYRPVDRNLCTSLQNLVAQDAHCYPSDRRQPPPEHLEQRSSTSARESVFLEINPCGHGHGDRSRHGIARHHSGRPQRRIDQRQAQRLLQTRCVLGREFSPRYWQPSGKDGPLFAVPGVLAQNFCLSGAVLTNRCGIGANPRTWRMPTS
jgi:hypothetical protein